MITLALLLAAGTAVAPVGRSDRWALVLEAARLAKSAPSSPVLDHVRNMMRGAEGLFDDEVSDSLLAVRQLQPALALLDAAAVAPACRSRSPLARTGGPALLALADHVLAVALVDALLDARQGKTSARAVSAVGRATTLAFLVDRCAGPPLEAFATSLDVHARTHALLWHLAEQRLIGARDLSSLTEQLVSSAVPRSLERALDDERARTGKAFTLEQQTRIDALGHRLDFAMRERATLAAAAHTFDAMARPPPFDAMTVKLRCSKSGEASSPFMVSRSLVRALQLRGSELLWADSQLTPTFDGRGVEITRAGALASSCGFHDGDLLLAVNGVATDRADVMMRAPAQVASDGHASFRVRRSGGVLEWRVLVQGRRPRLP